MFLDKNQQIISELEPEFGEKITIILNNCKRLGVTFALRNGNRNTFTQAVYWRRSRSSEEIAEKIKMLQNEQADFLAYCLFIIGEQQGPYVTDALPGLSWHQYGLAVDCAWIVDSKVCWDNENLYNGINGYEILATEAKKLGICSGHEWKDFKDSGHLQANFYASPLDIYTLKHIDQLMKEKYLALLQTNTNLIEHRS